MATLSSEALPTCRAIDGNEAVARIAYLLSDVAFIYPVS